ncbi:glycosyltransferase family 2 protein [Ramlibacter alkalitolerans]|uniref:Glycosyltransferase family 2 protein n=1 Tax=Ramlibacter alkalitolerans TaxID=2039631 RepID=A0ABS1JWV0_9BURK|nr:glycosyltransferase family 2 protein [Ramlibacter alkalitolerans]MBL0428682.1 glycosyltransferase family 2 protein [Ramlibacter alkalitolerans]
MTPVARIRVSAVITHYNRLELLARAVESVICQGAVIGEIIIVDDRTPGLSVEEIRRKLPQDDRVRVVQLLDNGGPQMARNAGLDIATCPVVALLDCDDVWLPGKVERQVHELVHAQADIVSSDVYKCYDGVTLIPDKKRRYSGDPVAYLLCQGGHLQTSTLLMWSKVARELKFDQAIRKFQDWDLIVRAHARNLRVALIRVPLSVYHAGTPHQMTGIPDPEQFRVVMARWQGMLSHACQFRARTRVLARFYVERGEVRKGFSEFADACFEAGALDFGGLARLVRKVVLGWLRKSC